MKESKWITSAEACTLLGVGKERISRWIRNGKLTGLSINGERYVAVGRDSVYALVEERKTETRKRAKRDKIKAENKVREAP